MQSTTNHDNWILTNADSPRAYAWRHNWGLVEVTADNWRLYFLVKNNMREVAQCDGKKLRDRERAPFHWAGEQIAQWNSQYGDRRWEERQLGNRKPGEEGSGGGKLIPKQTISADQARRADAKFRTKQQTSAR